MKFLPNFYWNNLVIVKHSFMMAQSKWTVFLLRYWKFVWNSFYYPTSSMPYTSCPITSILFRGFRFRNFFIKRFQLEEIILWNSFIKTKNETKVKDFKNHIKVSKLQVSIQRKYICNSVNLRLKYQVSPVYCRFK